MRDEVVVLTGASGCLGFHTLKLLLSRDENVSEVRCLDLVEPESCMKSAIEEELSKREERVRVVWIQGDVRDINTTEHALKGADCVIHCAAKIDIWTYSDDQDASELESINVGGTENLLRTCVRLGVHKFIHVSSFEVYTGYETIYYATESTLPNTKWFLFGPSGKTKKVAERKVREYSNTKLQQEIRSGKDSLQAIVVRFPQIYGEHEKYYVSKILEVTKFFGGKLRRMDNIWIRQQPIYAANAAWALVKAKQKMDSDPSLSGEEFHITDETEIGDPFDFFQPFIESRGMHVTKRSYSFLPIWALLVLFFAVKRFIKTADFMGLFVTKKGRLAETMERDQLKRDPTSVNLKKETKRWYHYVMPQTLGFVCNSCFLNRTKASLRLDYEPIVEPKEAKDRSLNWYKQHPVLSE